MNTEKAFILVLICYCVILLQIQGICVIIQSYVFFRNDILLKIMTFERLSGVIIHYITQFAEIEMRLQSQHTFQLRRKPKIMV
jgi:hypothetical protein